MFGREIGGGGPDLLEAGLDTGVGHGKKTFGFDRRLWGFCEPPPRPGAVAGEAVRTKSRTPQPAYRKP
jgi:hypothetical protein